MLPPGRICPPNHFPALAPRARAPRRSSPAHPNRGHRGLVEVGEDEPQAARPAAIFAFTFSFHENIQNARGTSDEWLWNKRKYSIREFLAVVHGATSFRLGVLWTLANSPADARRSNSAMTARLT